MRATSQHNLRSRSPVSPFPFDSNFNGSLEAGRIAVAMAPDLRLSERVERLRTLAITQYYVGRLDEIEALVPRPRISRDKRAAHEHRADVDPTSRARRRRSTTRCGVTKSPCSGLQRVPAEAGETGSGRPSRVSRSLIKPRSAAVGPSCRSSYEPGGRRFESCWAHFRASRGSPPSSACAMMQQ
jgi:hypothetical protein